jgi:DNA-binding NarL/FixJ family response regulator
MLTETEKKIINLVVRGLKNREIAAELEISVNTVKHHLTTIYQKTHTKSRFELKDFCDKSC